MLIDVRTGPQTTSDGGIVLGGRADRQGSLVIAQGTADWSEMARRGYVFSASTASAGVAPGTALSTSPPFVLLNPFNSGVQLHVLKATWSYVSGTLGAGTMNYVYGTGQTTIPATPLTSVNTLVGGNLSSVGRAYTSPTMASTAAIIRPAFPVSATAPATGVLMAEIIDGEFVVNPGGWVGYQEVGAAGTTPLGIHTMTWAELPL